MELYSIGIEDYFSCDSVVLIEWPDKGRGVLMPPTLTINITIESEKTRILTISTDDNKFVDLFDQMDQDRR
jgi:Predicted ATPase or kinase